MKARNEGIKYGILYSVQFFLIFLLKLLVPDSDHSPVPVYIFALEIDAGFFNSDGTFTRKAVLAYDNVNVAELPAYSEQPIIHIR
jgi:hypothetical protein